MTILRVLPILRSIPPLPVPLTAAAEFSLTQQLQHLATLNVTIAAALVGVLLLQGGQYYALRCQDKENNAWLEKRVADARRVLDGAKTATDEPTETVAQAGTQ